MNTIQQTQHKQASDRKRSKFTHEARNHILSFVVFAIFTFLRFPRHRRFVFFFLLRFVYLFTRRNKRSRLEHGQNYTRFYVRDQLKRFTSLSVIIQVIPSCSCMVIAPVWTRSVYKSSINRNQWRTITSSLKKKTLNICCCCCC